MGDVLGEIFVFGVMALFALIPFLLMLLMTVGTFRLLSRNRRRH